MSLVKFSPNLRLPTTIDSLARALGLSSLIFRSISECPDPEELYDQFRLLKRSWKPSKLSHTKHEVPAGIVSNIPSDDDYRYIWAPKNRQTRLAHKHVAANLDRFLAAHVPDYPHRSAYGYIKHRSTKSHAAQHIGAARLLSVDIKDFFPSISTGRIELALRKIGIHKNVSFSLARFLTINDQLPLGLNASPTIANLVAHPLDIEFDRISKELDCTYTRYADDITFSGKADLPSPSEIEIVLSRHGFKSNPKKYRASKKGQRHFVTGLSVSASDHPHVPRGLKKKLRQELYYIKKLGLESHLRTKGELHTQRAVNRLDGMVSYISSIEPRIAHKIRSQWSEICAIEGVERSFEPRPYKNLRDTFWFFDETEIQKDNSTKVLAICCVEIESECLIRLEQDINNLLEQEANDAYRTSKASNLHWAESTRSQREKLVDLLMNHLLRVVIVMDALKDGSDYKEKYCSLLGVAANAVMRRADDANVDIMIEANSSKVSTQKMKWVIENMYDILELENHRRPLVKPSITVSKKGARPALIVPDAMLGVFSQYAKYVHNDKDIPMEFTFFEKLRPRYSMIVDLHESKIFHRRDPFQPWSLQKKK